MSALLVLFSSALLRAEEPAACDSANLLAGKAPAASAETTGNLSLLTDGHVAINSARWDDETAIVLQSARAFVTYDLGTAHSISALYLQADADDLYLVEGSQDGSEGSYHELVVAPRAVVNEGDGLHARSLPVRPPSVVRFLRLSAREGDGLYSVTELAAYCQMPSPFPPNFATIGSPAQPASSVRAPSVPASDHGRFALVVLSIVLGLIGLVGVYFAPRGPRKPRAASADPNAGPSSAAERLLLVLFMLSGCAALVYEVVWLHLLRLVIGASSLSVGIVLASFMGGMFLGSLLFSRWVSPARNPLRVYAFLELGIGGFGLLMPLVLPLVRSIYVQLVGYGPLDIALRALIAATLLLPPTALMGATLPAVARRYSHGQRGMTKLAALYTANTLGAVLGSLLSAFYLLAVWDIWVATFAAAAVNAVVFLLALRLSRGPARHADTEVELDRNHDRAISAVGTPYAIYFAAAASGFTALGAQVIWTRLLTLLFGATVYVFALILAVFLASLGLGSALAAAALRRGVNPARALAWSQAALMPALLLSAAVLSKVLPYASPGATTPIFALHALHVLRAIDVILPAATLWGMSFPFALAASGLGRGDPARSSGQLYASNTVGAILGALAVSFWLIPAFGTERAERVLVFAAGVSAAVLFWTLARETRVLGGRALRAGAGLPAWSLSAGLLSAAFLPGLSPVFLAHGRYAWVVDARDQYEYVSEGASSTVAVHRAADGSRYFHVSGRVEASNLPTDLRLERMLGHLSALARPNPESVLVVGLGAGITAGALTLSPEIKHITICEIEPRVAGAAARFARENYDVLHNPRVTVVFDDARHFLETTHERFDIITSDPIHPWVRGNSILFSREYYAIVRSRLKPGGIATQWVPLYETSEEAIQIQMRTFTDAFPNGTVWNSAAAGRGYDVVLLGSEAPLRLDLGGIQARIDRTASIGRSLAEVRIANVVDLFSTYATNGQDMIPWLRGVPINDDFSLKLEYISGLALNDENADPIFQHMTRGRTYPAALLIASATQEAELRRRLP